MEWLIKSLIKLVFYLLLAFLPIFLLTRVAIYLHNQHEYHAYLSIAISGSVVFILLFIYLYRVHRLIRGKLKYKQLSIRRKLSPAFVITAIGIGFLLMYINAGNVKQDAIREEYLELHPVLRLNISLFVLFDQESVITDASRAPEDYKIMGLKSLKNSLHYPQSDGYVHAVDLRTNGRTEFRNKWVERIFKAMGFRVLRHVGTGDHLHISLKSFDQPNAI